MKKLTLILTAAALTLQAGSFTITDEARVTSSTPTYKTIIKRVPYQECWDESVPVRSSNGYTDSFPFGTIIGGVAGGVLGHQVGKGRGKDLATVGGALIGSIVGHNMSRENPRSYNNEYETRQRCVTRYSQNEEEKFIGYKNIAHYKGKRITKISQRRLSYIPITIHVRY